MRKMRKIFLITFLCLGVLTLNIFADEDPLAFQTIKNMAKDYAEKELSPAVDLFSGVFNTGFYAPVSGKIVSLGIQLNIVPIPKEGIFENVDQKVLAAPFLYGGVRVPVIGVFGLARAAFFPAGEKIFQIWGLGAGWEPNLIPLLNTKVLLSYHFIKNFPYIAKLSSWGGDIIVSFTKIPFVTPFSVLGFNRTTLQPDVAIIIGEKIEVSATNFYFSLGLKIMFITAEVAIVPSNTYSISAGFSF